MFDGWYQDIDKTEPWDFQNDVVQQNMTLYAKWILDNTPTADHGIGNDCPLCWLWLLLLLIVAYLLWRKYHKNLQEKRQDNEVDPNNID